MPILSQGSVMAHGSSKGAIYVAFRDLINHGFDANVLPSGADLVLPYRAGAYILDAVGFELIVYADTPDGVSFGQFGDFLMTQVDPDIPVVQRLKTVRDAAKANDLVTTDTIGIPQVLQDFFGIPNTVGVWRHLATGVKFALDVPLPYPTHEWAGVSVNLADIG